MALNDRDIEKMVNDLQRQINHLEKELKALRNDKDTDFKTIIDWIKRLFRNNNLNY